jgi:AcrR family transcriptional regulator
VIRSPAATLPSTRRGSFEDRLSARRRRLLETGLEVFGTVGYARSAIESICARAGVGTHGFYDCFESKEDLLWGVYAQIIGDLAAALQAALDSEPDDLERHVRAGVRATVELTLRDERAARVRLLEVVGVSDRLERRRREVLHRFADMVRADSGALHARGLVERPLTPMLAMAGVGGANELFIDWLLARRRPSARTLTDELTRLWLALLR